jgi:hypothetical protein
MIRIFGNSDDQVYVIQDGTKRQIDVRGDEVTIGVGLNSNHVGGCFVTMHYGVGCSIAIWTATIAQIDEEIPIPWPIRIETATAKEQIGGIHSVAVIIDCPPGTSWQVGPPEE